MVNDDPRSGWTPVTRYARKVVLWPLAQDALFGGAVNTRQTQTVFTDRMDLGLHSSQLQPWAKGAIEMPPPEAFRYGIMLPDAHYEAHVAQQTLRTWREWTDGVSADLLSGGKVRPGRRLGMYNVPKGTRTYYLNNIPLATGTHAADFELELGLLPAGVAQVTAGVSTSGGLIFAGTTPSGEPDSAAWPTGNYRFQIDCLSVNIDLTYGLLTQGTNFGHFARVNSALLLDLEVKQQQEAAFSLSGLKLATTGSVSWLAGSATDRFEILIAAIRVSGHGNANITLELGEADDFADGPWTAASPSTANAPFFGASF